MTAAHSSRKPDHGQPGCHGGIIDNHKTPLFHVFNCMAQCANTTSCLFFNIIVPNVFSSHLVYVHFKLFPGGLPFRGCHSVYYMFRPCRGCLSVYFCPNRVDIFLAYYMSKHWGSLHSVLHVQNQTSC